MEWTKDPRLRTSSKPFKTRHFLLNGSFLRQRLVRENMVLLCLMLDPRDNGRFFLLDKSNKHIKWSKAKDVRHRGTESAICE
jgi:hypothetical protein